MNTTPSDNTGSSLTVSIDCLKNDIGKIVVFPCIFQACGMCYVLQCGISGF